eukprot:g1310.t1
MTTAGDRIKHVVVLMLENRAFDHMFGFSSLPVDGLTGREFNRVNTSDPNSTQVFVEANSPYVGTCDPCHGVPCTTEKIFGNADPQHDRPTMDGFAEYQHNEADKDYCGVMNMFTEDKLPIISTLAREYAIFDRFFASVPGPTFPNRLFCLSGTSAGLTDTSVFQNGSLKLFSQRTIFDQFADANLDWRLYFHDFPWEIILDRLLLPKNLVRLKMMAKFHEDAKRGTLPAFSWINPRLFIDVLSGEGSNDQHPDHDVRLGEKLIKDVYECDSVPAPGDNIPSYPDDFDFTRGGIRIPTLLVSPWIRRNTVISDPTPAQKPSNDSVFELTSIPATMKKMFGLDAHLSNRSAWAATFESFIEDLAEPRTDCIEKLPDVPAALTEEAAAWEADRPLNDLQQDYVRVLSHVQGESAQHITHQRHGGEWVKEHVRAILSGDGLQGLQNCGACQAKGANCWFPKSRSENGGVARSAGGVDVEREVCRISHPLTAAAKMNRSVDITEMFFEDFDSSTAYGSETISVVERSVYRRPSEDGESACRIEWNENGTVFAAAHCDIRFFSELGRRQRGCMDSYVWDVENTSKPIATIRPPSSLCCLKFRNDETDVLIGGCYNGLVCLFDTRRGELPIASSKIQFSHHDPVYDVAWTQLQYGKEGGRNVFCSVSSDGGMCWWDVRRLTEPVCVESLCATDSETTFPGFGRSLSLSSTGDYVVGTEHGAMVSFRKNSLAPAGTAKRSLIRDAHLSSIVTVARSPLCPQYVLTVGDWRAQIWHQDLRSPVLSTDFHASELSAGCWSPVRPGVLFVSSTDGTVHVWDLYESHSRSSYSFRVGSGSIAALSCSPSGRLLATGTASGNVHLHALCDGLSQCQEAELPAVKGALDRETMCQRQMEIARLHDEERAADLKKIEEVRTSVNRRAHEARDTLSAVLSEIDDAFLKIMRE